MTSPQSLAKVAPDVQAALNHQRDGRLDKAEALYRKILNKVPDHPDALHMLGAIANDRGRPERGVQLILKALQAYPDMPEMHVNLGNSDLSAGPAARGNCLLSTRSRITARLRSRT